MLLLVIHGFLKLDKSIPCFGQLCCSLIPSIAMIYLGSKAVRNFRFKTSDFRPPKATVTHAIKLLCCLVLAGLSITSAIISVIREEQGHDAHVIGISYYSLVAAGILRTEYRRFGFTSSYLRIFLWVAFLAKITEILVVNIENGNPNGFDTLEVLQFSYSTIAAILSFFSWIWIKDTKDALSPETIAHGLVYVKSIHPRESTVTNNLTFPLINDSSINNSMAQVSHSHQKNFLSASSEHYQPGHSITINDPKFNKFNSQEPDDNRSVRSNRSNRSVANSVSNQSMTSNSLTASNMPTEKPGTSNQNSLSKSPRKSLVTTEKLARATKQNIRFANESQDDVSYSTSNKNELLDNPEAVIEVTIKDFEHTNKDGKKSVAYNIYFKTYFSSFTIQKSYSDFYKLYKKTMKSFPTIPLPPFPEKKTQSEAQMVEIILERKDRLNSLIKLIFEKKMFTPYLKKWINKNEDQSSEGTISRNTTLTDFSGGSPSLNRISPKDFYLSDDGANNRTKSDFGTAQNRRNSTEKSNKRPNERANTIVAGNAEDLRGTKLNLKGKEGSVIIFDYTDRAQSPEAQDEGDFRVTISKANTQEADGEQTTFYEVRVEDRLTFRTYDISKRYKDFKALHSELKDYAKQNRINLPELPFKGPIIGIVSNKNQKVIEYRRFALKVYLQQLLNIRKLRESPALQNFIGL